MSQAFRNTINTGFLGYYSIKLRSRCTILIHFISFILKLIIPKAHGAKLADIPDENLADILPVAKKIAKAIGCNDYNVLQNNGRLAHQEVDHVHFHLIPKPNETEGLGISWPSQPTDHAKFAELAASIKQKLENQ